MGARADCLRVTTPEAASTRRTWKQRWLALSAAARRRIVLGSLVAVALAARDLVLLFVAGGLFAASELAAPRPVAARASG